MDNQEKVWDEIAESWQKYRSQNTKSFQDVQKFLKEIAEQNPGKVLDIGIGNARNFIQFKNKKFKLYGVDFSEEMLKQAKKTARNNNLKIILKKANVIKLPYKNSEFDYVICISVLHHLNKKNQIKALKEVFRILKTNSIFLISVWNKKQMRNPPKFKQGFIKWKIDDKVLKRYYYFFDKVELENLLKLVGFNIIKAKEDKNIVFLCKKPSKV